MSWQFYSTLTWRNIKHFGDVATYYYKDLVRCFTFAYIFDRYNIKKKLNQVSRKRTSFKNVCLQQSILGNRGQNYNRLHTKNRRSVPISCKFVEKTLLYSLCMRCMSLASSETLRLSMFSQRRFHWLPWIVQQSGSGWHQHDLACVSCRQKLKEMRNKGRLIIKTSDTDVIVLYVHYFLQMTNATEVWVPKGNVTSVKERRRLCSSLDIIYNVLSAVHDLYGCDTTSSFFGIGKKSVFKVL